MTTITGELKRFILEAMSDGEKRNIPQIKEKVKEKSGMVFDKDYRTSHISSALNQLSKNNLLKACGKGIYKLMSAEHQNEYDNNKSSDKNKKKTSDIKTKVYKIEEEILTSIEKEHEFIIKKLDEVSMQEIIGSEEMDNMNRIADLAMCLEKFRLIDKRTKL